MADYYTLLTTGGLAYETACKAAGTPIKLTKMSVGDGNGQVYNPDATATALKREVWRGDINALIQDATNTSWLIAELTIPDNVGGWYVREAGIWTDTGILYAIIKYPESYKPVMATSGSAKEFYLRAIFQTSNASSVTLAIDETVVKATRAWVVDYVAAELAKRDAKQSVRVATTAAITLSGAQTIDGVAVVAGDRVLVKDQAAGATNGIYVAATGAWPRATDADISAEVTPGLLVSIEEGVANANTLWQLLTDATIVLGTTPLVFGPFYNNAQINGMLALKANLKSPAFTDRPTAPTADTGTNTDQLATTAFVLQQLAAFGLAGPAIAGDKMDLNSAPLGSAVKAEGFESEAAMYNRPVTGVAGSAAVAFDVLTYGSATRTVQQATHVFGTAGQSRLWVRVRHDVTWSPWVELARLASPALTGVPTAPTADPGTNSAQLATTAYVQALARGALYKDVSGSADVVLTAIEGGRGLIVLQGTITANISVILPPITGQWVIANRVSGNYTVTVKGGASDGGYALGAGRNNHYWSNGSNALQAVNELVSLAMTGTPTAPTPAAGNNSAQVATTAFVQASLAALVGSAPSTLDTLNELATALGNDSNFATTMANALAGKVPLAGGQMTGPLRGKVGAGTPGNNNNAGFVFDIDTGLFSPSDGVIQLVADGAIVLQAANGLPLQTLRGIRVPKGAPAAVDQSYLTGYAFAEDGDTGMFAEGGTVNAGADIVFRIDGNEAGRLKYVMKSSGVNGWARLMNGQILQWAEFTVSNTAGQVLNWQVTLPTTFPSRVLQKWATLGSGCTASKAMLTIEGQTNNSLLGYLYSEEAVSRVIRVWAIGE